MTDGTTIALNLHRIAIEQDFQETLLNEEKCVHCGRELMTEYSRKTHCCGACSRKGLNGRPTTNMSEEKKKARAEKHGWDYDFNKGHGERFFRAFDRAFNLQPITVQENPSGSIPQPAEDNVADRFSPAENGYLAGFCPASHAGARIFTQPLPNPRCALAHLLSAGRKSKEHLFYITQCEIIPPLLRIPADSNEEPGMQFCSHTSLLLTTSLPVMQTPRFRSGELHYMRMLDIDMAYPRNADA